jgi:hypothetical protein
MMHSKETTQAGAPMSHAPSYVLMLRRTAIYVDKILVDISLLLYTAECPLSGQNGMT